MPRNYTKKVDKIQFSEEQVSYIEENWDKKDVVTIAQTVFADPTIDGHRAEARKIKEYLISRFGEQADIKMKKTPKKEDRLGLTPEQEEFLRNNAGEISVEEATAVLFPEKYTKGVQVSLTDKEFIWVYAFVQSINPALIAKEDQLTDEVEYRPPGSIARMVPRINLYITKGSTEENKKFLEASNLKPQERKWVEALIGYTATHRFKMLMSEYKKKIDRELAESSFIRWCYGKEDLLEEEVDSYISLVEEVVDSAKIRRQIEKLDEQSQKLLEGNDSDSKIKGMTLIELINSQRDKLKLSKDRTEKLLSRLVESRSNRMKQRQEKTASLLNLVELWKNEESRKKMIALANKRQALLATEVERLSSMESLKAEIYGLDKGDIAQ
jgi:hypothetical protein